jgi:hypothetical protein
MLDLDASEGLGELPPEQAREMLQKCGGAVVFLDCGQSKEEEIFSTIEILVGIIVK